MKWISRFSLPIVTLILCGLLWSFINNLAPTFKQVEEDYKQGRAINLSADMQPDSLAKILIVNGYANDSDAYKIADTLKSRMENGLVFNNLYDLQKRAYGKVSILQAEADTFLLSKIDRAYQMVGWHDSLPDIKNLSNEVTVKKSGTGSITVQLYLKHDKKLFKDSDLDSAYVRLTAYSYNDSLQIAYQDTIVYARTQNGEATFNGLDKNLAYNILPIKRGFEYGSSKNIKLGHFKKDTYTFRFEQLEHRLQMIDDITLKHIKSDGTITVRTPEAYKKEAMKWFAFVLIAWWLMALVLLRRKRSFDPLLLSAVMFLTGLCVIIMYGIQNPLTEEMRGTEMATGVLGGIAVILLFQFVDFIKLYQNRTSWDFDIPLSSARWLFLPFKQKVSSIAATLSGKAAWYKKLGATLMLVLCLPFALFNIPFISRINPAIVRFLNRAPKGFGWLMLAILLTMLLWTPLGQEIGGMKVNLRLAGLTFQPSEIAKYLILFFMAAFFTQNADSIIAYSQPGRTKIWDKIKTLGWVIGGLLVLMALYAVLGDMGPALVIGVTFIILYSLIKSKVNLDNLTESTKWKRIFTCDFAMLIYGVVTFVLFIFIGGKMGHPLIFARLWFAAWILFGFVQRKQFFETAFIINLLVFCFVFGGDVAKSIPVVRDTDVAERFDERTSMCTNTWGDLDIEHNGTEAKPVSNTQVANGLWAIATGGMTGQGLGDGNPHLIPAFHTDMILSSIAEQMGWFGLLFVVITMALLLRRIIVVGYRVGHPFAFYFCTGVAIVTAVQFFIIALGSSGMIPLTGITVPFLSYGRVSMILNLAAIGVVLSLSKNIQSAEKNAVLEQISRRSVGDYNYPISFVTWTYILIAMFTLGVWQHYALWDRDDTLIRPAYVHTKNGLPDVTYNPRIPLITEEMWAGDIYDRNGLLLATSNPSKLDSMRQRLIEAGLDINDLDAIRKAHTKRYYPFQEHLFFILGDLNTNLFLHSSIGYMAESRHMSYLRGYRDTYYDAQHRPVNFTITRDVTIDPRILDTMTSPASFTPHLHDYSELLPYLKAGVNSSAIKQHNKRVKDKEIALSLTIDAALQVSLQNEIQKYVEEEKNNRDKLRRPRPTKKDPVPQNALRFNRLLRISVVVLDAQNGDLLASANYPLPDYERMYTEDEKGRKGLDKKYYYDQQRDAQWTAYTDCDLGLTNPTPPGSTAKVMSAMAGLNKLGNKKGANRTFDIQKFEAIDYGKNGVPVEPPYGANHQHVKMREALIESSNCYFIYLVNSDTLYPELEKIYTETGVRVELNKRMHNTYYIQYPELLCTDSIDSIVTETQNKALSEWEKYQTDKQKGKYINGIHEQKLRKDYWMWAWGQNMSATPLTMARVASAVANNGVMLETRYVTTDTPKNHTLTTKTNADSLMSFMKGQYSYQANEKKNLEPNPIIGGKTGTPHRDYKKEGEETAQNKSDGWYVFFVDNQAVDKSKSNIAVAIRMERIGLCGGSSTDAMWLAKEVVIPTLKKKEYIK